MNIVSAGHGLFVAWELQRDVKIIAHFAQLLIGSNVSPLASDSTVHPDGSDASPSALGLAFFNATPSEFQIFLLRQSFVNETFATSSKLKAQNLRFPVVRMIDVLFTESK